MTGEPDRARRTALRPAARDAAHPPLRGDAASSCTAPAKIRGFLHLYIGEEAVAVGAMQALDAGRRHRRDLPRARPRARPRRPGRRRSWPRCSARSNGCSRGRGGSMHLFDAARRFYGGNAIVGGGLPLAVGLALADKMQRPRARRPPASSARAPSPRASSTSRMNLAALWKLPVLFLLREQPLRDGHGARRARSRETDLALQGRRATSMPAWSVDGMDVARRRGRGARAAAARSAPAAARTSSSCAPTASAPTRCTTPSSTATRTRSSAGSSATRSRSSTAGCASAGCSTTPTSRRIEAEVAAEIDAAVAFAEAGDLRAGRGPRRASCTPSRRRRMTATATTSTTYREAMRAGASRDALRARRARLPHGRGRRPLRRLLRASAKGLLDEFGPERIRDTPLSESAFVGAGHRRRARRHAADRRDHDGQLQPARARPDRQQRRDAAAHVGRPVQRPARHPHDDRRRPPARRAALAQPRGLVRPHPGPQGARARPRSRTRAACCWPALADPDPVLIFEHGSLYNIEGELAADRRPVDIAHAAVRRAGDGRHARSPTAARLPQGARRGRRARRPTGIDAEVIDLRVAAAARRRRRSSRRSRARTAPSSSTRAGAPAASPPRSARASWRAPSTSSTRRSRASAAPRCRCPTRKHLEEAALPAGRRHRRRGAQDGGGPMAEFLMPSLGADMDAGTLVEWHVAARRRGAPRRHRRRRRDRARPRSTSRSSRTAWSTSCSCPSGERCPSARRWRC